MKPTTCVGITTFNRGALLKNSLERMTHLTLPDEILVVSDGCTDNTLEICESFKDRLPIRTIFNHNPEWSICSFARNILVKNTDADLIITTEPEVIWITDILPLILEERKKYPNEIISASIIYHGQPSSQYNAGFATDPETALKNEIVEEYQTAPRSYHPNGYCKTTNMQATFVASYERKWLMEVNGWDEEFPGCWGWDDIDLCTRLRINGINQHICKKLQAIHQWHPHPPGDIWTKGSHDNELHLKGKELNKVEEQILESKRVGTYKEIHPSLVANKDREWGVIKTQ